MSRAVLVYSDSKVFSGAEALLCDIVRGLASRPGAEIRCAAPHANVRLVEGLRDAADVEPIDVPAQPLAVAAVHLYDPRRRSKVSRVISQVDPDVLLVNLPSAEYGATPILEKGPVPAVGLLHIAGSPRELGFQLGGLRERLARRALGEIDAVCVAGPSAAGSFARFWGEGDKARVLRLPRPSIGPVDQAEARRALDLPDGPLVGIAGRISFKQKGHDTLVEAAGLLASRRPDIRYAVAGDGRDRARLERLLERGGLAERFHLVGHVSPVEIFLSAIDAIVIPSRFEGLPLIALEALAVGAPGIAASVDGLRDVWPAEWQVPPGSGEALAGAVERLFASDPEERKRLVDEGRALMERCTGSDPSAEVEEAIAAVSGT